MWQRGGAARGEAGKRRKATSRQRGRPSCLLPMRSVPRGPPAAQNAANPNPLGQGSPALSAGTPPRHVPGTAPEPDRQTPTDFLPRGLGSRP